LIETVDDPRETAAHTVDQLADDLEEADPVEFVAIPRDLGRPPPYAMLSCRHPGRTVYVVLGLFGAHCVRLCRKPPPGLGWHGHGEILRQWWTTSGTLALEVVAVLADTADPDGLLDALTRAEHWPPGRAPQEVRAWAVQSHPKPERLARFPVEARATATGAVARLVPRQ
jgi:hypothetical protein